MEALRKLSLGNNPKSRYVATLKAIATGIETDILHQLIKRSGLKTTATAVAAVLLPVTHADQHMNHCALASTPVVPSWRAGLEYTLPS